MDMFAIDEMTAKDLSYLDGFDLHLVSNEQEMENAFTALSKASKGKEPIGLDIETTGLSPMHHEIVSVIMSPPDDKTSYYFPLKHKIGVNIDEVQFLAKFEQLCKEAKFVLHNGKFDWEFIWHNWNIDFEISDDTMLMAYVLNSNLAESGSLGLKYLTGKYFDYHPLELSDFKEYDFSRYDPEEGYKYAAPDTINTVKLYHKFKPLIKKFHLERVYRVEMNIVKMLGRMELQGVDVDPAALQTKEEAVKKLIDELTQKIQDMAGHPFDVASPQQLSTVLYQELKIKPTRSHGKDDLSTGADVMRKLQNAHPIIPLVLDLREAQKLYNDFIIKLPECLAEDHKIHSRFVQTGTRSGRFSSAGGYGKNGEQIRANMQQLPNDKKLADGTVVSVREAFVAPEGFLWVSCDYRTMEYKTLANLAHEDGLIQDLRNGVDFHIATASLMLGIPKDKVTKDDRKKGKTLNFGICYGLTDKGLSDALGVDIAKAKGLRTQYFQNLPRVSAFMEGQKKDVITKGFVTTCSGRMRIFSDAIAEARATGNSYAIERAQKAGANTAVQGSAADLAKLAMWRLDCLLEPYRDKIIPVLQIHDAIDFLVAKDFPLDKFYQLVSAAMVIRDVQEWAPIDVDFEIGENYGNLKGPEAYGLDTEALDADNPFIELLPDCDWFFDPIRKETTSYYDKLAAKPADTGEVFMDKGIKEESERNAKINARKAKLLEKYSETESVSETSEEHKQHNFAEVSKKTILNESTEASHDSLVLTPLFDDSQDEEAFSVLSEYIANSYGTFDMILTCAGSEYRFPPDYRVNPDKLGDSMKRLFAVEIKRSGKPKSIVLDL